MKDAIRYVVTVSAVVERVETAGKEWVALSESKEDGTHMWKREMGYSPEIEKTVRKEIEVYKQAVDVLDMAALVSVVNKSKES